MNDKIIILLVEDNDGILFNLKLALEMSQFEVITATNGKEAILILEQLVNLPDIIVSDIMMPEMGGYEFFEYVSSQNEWNDIPFIFLTAKASPNDILLGTILGADDYLIKPVKNEDLIKIINSKIIDSTKEKITKEIIKILEINGLPDQLKGEEFMFYRVLQETKSGSKQENIYSTLNVQTKQLVYNIGYQIASLFLPTTTNATKITSRSYFFSLSESNLKIFLLFDVYSGGKWNYVIVLLSTMLSYFKVLRLKYYFYELMTEKSFDLNSLDFNSMTDAIRAILEITGE